MSLGGSDKVPPIALIHSIPLQKMKWIMSVLTQCWVLNTQPSERESHPITTRPFNISLLITSLIALLMLGPCRLNNK